MSESVEINAEQAADAEEATEEGVEQQSPSALTARKGLATRFSTPVLAAAVSLPLLFGGGFAGMMAAKSAAPAVAEHHAQWSYEGAHGPAHWGEVDPHARVCQTGTEQSPIDIRSSRLLRIPWLDPLQIGYKPSKARLVNNGHTYQINYEPGSMMTFNGQKYELVQFQFHTPSEHWVDGRQAAMEMQIVHVTPDVNRSLAIVGVFFVEGPENPFLSKFWHQMPDKPGPEIASEIVINAADVLPRNLRYYQYDGSLTTPPCTEGVKWILLKQPVTASRAQIEKFSQTFGMNARPPQPVNDRWIKEELPPGER